MNPKPGKGGRMENREEYWIECVQTACEEAGIIATDEQVRLMADVIQTSHENIGLAFGNFCIPNPVEEENKRLKKELEKEKGKVVCPRCKGRGVITDFWGCGRSSVSQCSLCDGEGRCPPEAG